MADGKVEIELARDDGDLVLQRMKLSIINVNIQVLVRHCHQSLFQTVCRSVRLIELSAGIECF